MPETTSLGTATRRRGDLRLPFLDGMRGFAALYVVVFHNTDDYLGILGGGYAFWFGWLRHGVYAVDVFIVLSGFCLMMPVAARPGCGLPGGLRRFLARRAWRILPPYYAALLLTWALLVASPQGVAFLRGSRDADWLHNFAPGNVISHLLLLHNLRPDWVMGIDYPTWTIATEWQIYFVFALLLLPLWRRWGIEAAVCAACLLGVAPQLLLRSWMNFDWAMPWLLGLFSFGMAGAVIAFSPERRARRLMENVPWGIATLALFAAVCLYNPPQEAKHWRAICGAALLGLAAMSFILHCIQSQRKGRGNPFIRVLESRGAALLGAMSYSLYLVHVPAMTILQPWLDSLRLGPPGLLGVHVFVFIPWVLGVAGVFCIVVERPCVRRGKADTRRQPGEPQKAAAPGRLEMP